MELIASSMVCFNSSVVQFREAEELNKLQEERGFNSSVVQFRVSGKVYPIKDVSVSIPVWYNLEIIQFLISQLITRFNSSVVQFRALEHIMSFHQ